MLAFVRARPWILPFILFALNAGLKLLFITSNPIALDEPFTVFYAQPAFGKMLRIHLADNTPPLFDLFLFGWIKFFGTGAFSVRFLPCLFSSLTVIYVFLLGKKTGGIITALGAALVFSFSSFHFYFAHEARAYSLFALLSTASLYYYFCLEEKSSRRYFFSFIGVNILLAYTHYFGFIVIGGELILSFLFLKQFPFSFRKVWLGFVIWLAFISPLIIFCLKRFNTVRRTGFWVSTPPWDAWYDNIRKFCNEPVVAICFLLLVTLGLVQMIRKKTYRHNHAVLVLPLFFFGIYFSLFFFSFIIPVFLDRYLIFLSIPFYLLVGTSISYLVKGSRMRIYLLGAVSLGMVVTVDLKPGNGRDPVGMANYIRSKKDGNTAVFIAPPWLDKGVMYYCRPDFFRDEANFDRNLESDRWFRGYSLEEAIKKTPAAIHRLLYVASGDKVVTDPKSLSGMDLSGFRYLQSAKFGQAEGVLVLER
ncbi:MAG: glycosyltransferase family 39 protein [Bacteroidia bacterium]